MADGVEGIVRRVAEITVRAAVAMDVDEAWSRDESFAVDDVVAISCGKIRGDGGDDAAVDENIRLRQIDIRRNDACVFYQPYRQA